MTKTLTKFKSQVLTLMLTLAALMVGQTAWADWTGTCGAKATDNVTWAVTDTNGDGTYETITISGSGAMKNYSSSNQPWAAFKSGLTTVVIGDGVTSIGGNAFWQFTALTSVSIASSVTTIGNAAFSGCTNLATINGASGVTNVGPSAFVGTAWENNLPDGLTYVGHVAYRFKGDGTSVTLNDATTQIYDYCFSYSKITSIVIPASVKSIGEEAFYSSALKKIYVLRSGSDDAEITQLGEYAFYNCSKYLAIVVPDAAYVHYSSSWNSYRLNLKHGYTVTSSTAGITATSYAPIVAQGEEVTLAAPGYVITSASYSYNDGTSDHTITPDNGVWSFLMPASNVTVTATCKKLLTNTDIAVGAIADQPYTGSDITPEVTVWDGTTDISGECDFAYSDNEDTGTATVTITAKAASTGYSGSRTTTFNIVPKNVGDYGAVQILEDQYGKHGIIDGNYLGDVVVNLEEDIEVADVTFNRTFTTDAYSTIMLPFEVSMSQLSGVDYIYTFSGVEKDANDTWTAAVTEVYENSEPTFALPAYTPYIVKMNDTKLSISHGVIIQRTSVAPGPTTVGDWELRGTLAYTVWDATHNNADLGRVYGFAATAVAGDKIEIGDFVRAEAGAYIYPFRAYLYYKGTDTNWNHSQSLRRAPAIDELPDRIPVRIVDDEDADRISLTPALSKGEGDWYIIDGRKLGGKPTQRGLYINGGKKVVV